MALVLLAALALAAVLARARRGNRSYEVAGGNQREQEGPVFRGVASISILSILSRNRIFLENLQKSRENGGSLERTMVERNGESTPRVLVPVAKRRPFFGTTNKMPFSPMATGRLSSS